ncbi:hypothetical protein C8R43DRAFT_905000 [Mycena crocata]|nr:hypothetical protein C8R43DRAFT_905000 [Mycena crocata]
MRSTFQLLLTSDTDVQQVQVTTCACASVAAVLVRHGVFPASPSKPRTAISIDLLEVYRALFERSCDAITALAAALHTIYDRRGFRVLSTRNRDVGAKDPFRAGLTQAVQAYSNLRVRLQARLDSALASADAQLFPILQPDPLDEETGTLEAPEAHPPLTPGRASRRMREICPTCFALEGWGRPLSHGGDVQLGSDGCFSYRHLRSAGDGPISYDPSLFVSKEKVDKVRDRIAKARTKQPTTFTPPIPQEAIDSCATSWDAANEKKQKADPKRYDASGVFVMTCRHSQVLFLCNIDTPGEQQQYIVALMEELNANLPREATIIQCYDVACVTEHSINLYPILTEGFRERVGFVINAMHAYGHQWICQLVYSPRLRRGLGLTDAEGVERFWSRIRKLIGITRNQWNSRRIWMIDQYAAFVNSEGRDNLGAWITRQQTKNITKKHAVAIRVLRQCGVAEAELRSNWAAQKAAQTSVRSHAPVRLRRELNKVLTLQGQIDAVDKSIADAKTSITASDASADALALLRRLENTHEMLSAQAAALYASLNIQKSFPELEGLPLEFVKTLLVMRDLKINIRARAVGSFHEWESLDRAVGGRREALGTKLHQSTRKAISRRQPALLKAIAKFNGYCAELEELRPVGCNIPIPSPLSTQLNGLRDDPTLHEDVWVTPSVGHIPRWLEDIDVRDGIRALHSKDRCEEEAVRLNLERENMSRWLTQERRIVELAIATSSDPTIELPLQQRQEHLQGLQVMWEPALRRCLAPSPYTPNPVTTRNTLHSTPSPPSPVSDSTAPTVTVVMVPEDDLFEDSGPLDDAADNDSHIDPGNLSDPDERVVVGLRHWPILEIEPPDLDRVISPTGRLNNFAINGIAASLLSISAHPHSPCAPAALRCALFSTLDLPRVQFNGNDDSLWRHTSHIRFWEKPIWLIPIHRATQQHWVLVVASIPDQRLLFFDSLGQEGGWRRDLRNVMALITRLVVLANRHGNHLHVTTEEEEWNAYPLYDLGAPLQTNGHDCGLWILCMMGAIMRGFHTTAVSEADMGRVRNILSTHVLTLPIT